MWVTAEAPLLGLIATFRMLRKLYMHVLLDVVIVYKGLFTGTDMVAGVMAHVTVLNYHITTRP